GDLNLISDGVEKTYVYLDQSNQIASSALLGFYGSPTSSSRLNLRGHVQTVAGISCSTGRGVIQNTDYESGVSANGTLTVNNAADCYYDGYLRDRYLGDSTGKLAIVKSGAGALTLAGSHIYYTGGTTVSGGELVLEDVTHSTFLATNITNNATLEFNTDAEDFNYGGNVSGTGSVVKTGDGELTLSGANTNTGSTVVEAGALRLNATSGVAIAGNLDVTGDAQNLKVYVYLDDDDQIASTSVVTFSNAYGGSSRRLNLLGHNQTVAGLDCADGTGVIQHTETESGVTNNGELTVNTSGNHAFQGFMRDRYQGDSTCLLAFVKSGSGTQTLAGSNIKYTGGTTVSGGKLVLQDTTNATFLTKNITNNATLEFANTTANVNYSGVVSGSGALIKSGGYRLTLSGNNTYTGATTVSGGTLDLSASSLAGSVTVQSGATFAPGVHALREVTTGTGTWSSGGEYLWEINDADGAAGTNWDVWNVTGNLSIASTFTIDVDTLNGTSAGSMDDFNNQLSYSWLLAETTGTISGFANLALDTSGFQNALDPEGYLYLSQSGSNQLYLNYSPTGGEGLMGGGGLSSMSALSTMNNPVPEPGCFVLLIAMGVLGLLLRRTKNR
ncbi:MAG TPA: autotransporter-associated beta strand repeat-containing protein, partial [Thermoguttaceae bacterium]|nr:autotransporter-associated beta strand repeat-containing protein [Thermoguttaceae bacterium]